MQGRDIFCNDRLSIPKNDFVNNIKNSPIYTYRAKKCMSPTSLN